MGKRIGTNGWEDKKHTDLHEQKETNVHCYPFIWLHAERNNIVNDATANKQEVV